jgi:PKD repeat protein
VGGELHIRCSSSAGWLPVGVSLRGVAGVRQRLRMVRAITKPHAPRSDASDMLMRRTPAARTVRHLVLTVSSILLALVLAPRAEATPDARFVASKVQGTTCVAPCAVHFDAIGTGSNLTRDTSFPRAFHSLLFHWEFGDPGSGTWAVSGKSKDRAIGAIAGHLYRNPGTYTARLTVTNAYGETDSEEQQVVVADPDVHFASTTWCFANTGTPGGAGFEACPTRTPSRHVVIGANVSSGFDLALGSGYCNAGQAKNRCLFRAGDTFGHSGGLVFLSQTGGPGLLTRFGAGADPRVVGGDGLVSARDGWTIANFDVEPGAGNSNALVQLGPQRRNVTAVQLRARNLGGSCFTIQTGSVPTHNDLVAAIELDCKHVQPSTGTSIFLRAERTLVMGNVVDLSYLGEFSLRTVHFPHSIVQHNRFTRPNAGPVERNVIQLRSWSGSINGSPADNQPPPTPTEYVIVSDNELSQDNASMVIRTCQTNTCGDAPNAQNMQHVIFERNFFQFTSQAGGDGPSLMPRAFWLQGGDITIRDNIFDLQGIELGDGYMNDRFVQQAANASTSPMNDDDLHVLNNVVYFDETIDRPFKICSSSNGGTGHRCQNNLIHLPNHRGDHDDTEGPGWLASNNVFTAANPFVRPVPGQGSSSPSDFQLAPAAAVALDTGYDFGSEDTGVQVDFGTACRPADGNADSVADIDVGAWERNASTACLPAPEPGAVLAGLGALAVLAALRRRA